MIKAQVIGNLGKDCIVNNVNGKNVINFSVAHTEKFKDAQGVQHDKTTWVECSYWTDRTGIAPYLQKGQLVYVEGQPDIRIYTTKEGRQGASMSLRVSQVQLLGGNKENGRSEAGYQNQYFQQVGHGQGSTPQPNASDITEPDQDLPF